MQCTKEGHGDYNLNAPAVEGGSQLGELLLPHITADGLVHLGRKGAGVGGRSGTRKGEIALEVEEPEFGLLSCSLGTKGHYCVPVVHMAHRANWLLPKSTVWCKAHEVWGGMG